MFPPARQMRRKLERVVEVDRLVKEGSRSVPARRDAPIP
jgi:hypothetical protein